MAKVTMADAKKVASELKLGKRGFTLADLRHGMQVELEHTDVTHGNMKKTAKIALAHLKESPLYYKKLDKMEKTFKKDERGKKKQGPKKHAAKKK